MDFNLQTFLSEMKAEQKDDHNTLADKVDTGFRTLTAAIAKQDTRIVRLEDSRKNMRWLGAAVIVALLTVLGDLAVNHLLSEPEHVNISIPAAAALPGRP